MFYTLAQELNLSVTFGQGIDICCTDPGRLYFGLLAWAEGGFKVSNLIPLIADGELYINDEHAPTRTVIVRFLRTSGIGWGQDRYHTAIERELNSLEESPPSEENRKRVNLLWLKNFFEEVFALLPEPDSEQRISYGKLAAWLLELVDRFSPTFSAVDGEAKTIICSELQIIRDSFSQEIEPEEAYKRLGSLIEEKVSVFQILSPDVCI